MLADLQVQRVLGPKTRILRKNNTRVTILRMSKKTVAGLLGAFAVVAILLLQSLERWTVIDSVMKGLQNWGSVGGLIANALDSKIVPLVLALTAIYLVIEGRKERDEKSEPATDEHPTSNSISYSAKSSATGGSGGNAQITQYIGIPPFNDPPHPKPQPAPPTDAKKQEKSLHNIKLVRTKNVFVEARSDGFYEVGTNTGLIAYVACFRNEALFGQDDIEDASDVSTTMHFFEGSEEILEGVAGGCWLSDSRAEVDLCAGRETRNAILLIHDRHNDAFFVPLWTRVPSQWGLSLTQDICGIPKGKMISKIRLLLIGPEGLVIPQIDFRFQAIEGEWILAPL